MMPLNIQEITRSYHVSCFLKEKDPLPLSRAFEKQVSQPLSPEVLSAYDALYRYGPFPEPFLRQNERFSRKWHQDYISLVIRQDLKDISRVTEIDKVENLLFLIPSRIMAPLSMANLAGELEVAHTTVRSWLEQLKRLYLLFPVGPWTMKISRGLKKENKWYFLDWYYAPEGPARLENMVATYLYRVCHAMTDMGFGHFRLHYIRTLDKKEIDFVIAADNRPVMAVEVKSGETQLSRSLSDRRKWFPNNPTLGIQVVDKRGAFQKRPDNTWVISVERLLARLI